MTISLPPLPYPLGALEPYIGRDTVDIHYGKHQATYVSRANELMADAGLSELPLENVIVIASQIGHDGLFNNAAQAWNHAFYWNSLRPKGGGAPHGTVATLIEADFGDYESFAEEFRSAATSLFGSGWVWLVLEDGRLQIVQTHDADNPLVRNQIPLLAIDVWEHAYYLDYQQRRPAYLNGVVNHLINWDFANLNLDRDWRSIARAPDTRLSVNDPEFAANTD